jgi:hypothetical protein
MDWHYSHSSGRTSATSVAILMRRIDRGVYRNAAIILALLAIALLTRAGRVGDPAIQMDEQFYLLVADQIWHGALPYVDVWDRKPILLFLIYAALRPLSPDGIVAYQIGAMLFATMTAFVIVLIAQRFTNLRGAWFAGAAYLVYLPVLGGGGGQSPVFYNLFMAIGALEVFRADESPDSAGVWRHGLRAMLWAGLAMQMKYTAAIEGVAYGLWLTILLLRRNGSSPSRLVAQVGLWMAAALAPTLLAAGFYVLIGHGQAFVEANFLSIFRVHEPDDFSTLGFLHSSALRLAPLLLFAVFSSSWFLRREAKEAPVAFLLLWTTFAIAGFFAIGNYYEHYALPLIVPMMIVCAPLLGTLIGGMVGMTAFGSFAALVIGFPPGAARLLDESHIAAMVDAARPYAAHGCIYLNDGPTIVYLLTHSCLPTRYVFPEHLNNAAEARATNATRSMADLLATRPSAIFVADKLLHHPRNSVTAAMLDAALARDYQRVGTLPDIFPTRQQILYARKDLLPQQATRR